MATQSDILNFNIREHNAMDADVINIFLEAQGEIRLLQGKYFESERLLAEAQGEIRLLQEKYDGIANELTKECDAELAKECDAELANAKDREQPVEAGVSSTVLIHRLLEERVAEILHSDKYKDCIEATVGVMVTNYTEGMDISERIKEEVQHCIDNLNISVS